MKMETEYRHGSCCEKYHRKKISYLHCFVAVFLGTYGARIFARFFSYPFCVISPVTYKEVNICNLFKKNLKLLDLKIRETIKRMLEIK